ncbi:Inner membrane transport protein YdhP [Corynebacterium oculi]|uniref:Inner membrane transport protein YdhP n=2 Tax=Corynebacterium oculi TaxID=1544416 RepID=A0A0Q1AD68_9CORY|nr:Inner membrane transport protein YdhP [Corynebacterium oculi]
MVTSELQTAGMMPYLAQGLEVGIGEVGGLVTVYALGMAIGGPAIVYLFRNKPPKTMLALTVLCYSILEIVTIAQSSILWMLVFRFLTGSLSGAVFGFALSFAARVASDPREIPKDISFVLNGLMIGGIIGMPLSHAIAESAGWRWSFILLGVVAALVSLMVWVVLYCHFSIRWMGKRTSRMGKGSKVLHSGFAMGSAS